MQDTKKFDIFQNLHDAAELQSKVLSASDVVSELQAVKLAATSAGAAAATASLKADAQTKKYAKLNVYIKTSLREWTTDIPRSKILRLQLAGDREGPLRSQRPQIACRRPSSRPWPAAMSSTRELSRRSRKRVELLVQKIAHLCGGRAS